MAGSVIRWLGLGTKFNARASLAPAQDRLATKTRIESYTLLNARNGDATDLVFQESKASYDLARDRLKTLDGKAGTLIGIVTTGFGAIALLGDPAKVPAHSVWLYLALIFLGAAFVFALLSLAPRAAVNPDISPYNLDLTLQNPANAVRIKYDLTEAWLRDAATVEHASTIKGRRLLVGTAALFIGLLALAFNYAIAGKGETPIPTIRVIVQPSSAPAP